MRENLLNPPLRDPRVSKAVLIAREIDRRFEAGQDYSASLARLCERAHRPIDKAEVCYNFGTYHPEVFARRSLTAWDRIPTDVTDDEMLEMIDRICR